MAIYNIECVKYDGNIHHVPIEVLWLSHSFLVHPSTTLFTSTTHENISGK